MHQPVATDLRRISTMMKVNNDLERMADLAVNIAERSHSIQPVPEFSHSTTDQRDGIDVDRHGPTESRCLHQSGYRPRPTGDYTG